MSVAAHKKSYHEYTDDDEVKDFIAQAGDDMYSQMAQVPLSPASACIVQPISKARTLRRH